MQKIINRLNFSFIILYIKSFLKNFVIGSYSPSKLAMSFSIGIFIAFSPYIGFHNIMILLFSWLFGLNLPLTFFIAHINNPITLVPILVFSYLFGIWLFKDILGINLTYANPSFMEFINVYLTKFIGISKINLWYFVFGANILGILLALFSYPIVKLIFIKIINQDVKKIS